MVSRPEIPFVILLDCFFVLLKVEARSESAKMAISYGTACEIRLIWSYALVDGIVSPRSV
jgi:hypothetical protein